MILALDTSGGELLVCLLDDEMEIAAGVCIPGRRHQEGVLDAVAEVLGGREGIANLGAVAVVRGPGSQTGLRVGMAAAEGLAFGPRLQLIPLSSLAVAAHRAAAEGEVLAAVSAGRSNVYAQLFQARGAARVPTGRRLLGGAPSISAQLTGDRRVPLGAEAQLLGAFGVAADPQGSSGVEALAAASREAIRVGTAVSYHGLTGDYGE